MKNYYFDILNKKQKFFFYLIIILVFLGALLETVGIASIFPVLSIIVSDQSDVNNFEYIKIINNWINIDISKKNKAIYFFSLFIVIFFIFKNLYLLVLKFYSETFLFKFRHQLSFKIFKSIILKKYPNFIEKNSSFYISLILNIVSELVNNIYSALIFLIKEVLLFLFIFALLLFYNFELTIISVIFFSVISLIIFLFSKKSLYKWSKQKIYHDDLQIRSLNEAFSLIKFMKISSSENFFLKKFGNNNLKTNLLSRNLVLLDYLPNVLFETLIIIFLGIFMIYLSASNSAVANSIPILAIFTLSAIRLRPSVGQILKSFNNLRYGKEFLKTYIANINHEELDQKKYINLTSNLEIKNLSFKYNDKKIFNNLNLIIKKGQMLGIHGRTGSGKTTLIDVVCGLHKMDRGNIAIDNNDIENQYLYNLLRIGYVPQDVFLIDGSIEENIKFNIQNNDDLDLQKSIEVAELKNFIDELRLGVKTTIGENGKNISGGQKQRIGLARALYQQPDLLILDEATNALDQQTQIKICKKLRELKITTIIISHQIENFKECDKIINIDELIIR